MTSWESLLGPGTIDWLLEPENPSVRYITLTDLLDADPRPLRVPACDVEGAGNRRLLRRRERVVGLGCRDGRWSLEATFNGRFQLDMEAKGKPSRWITLRALRLLMAYYA